MRWFNLILGLCICVGRATAENTKDNTPKLKSLMLREAPMGYAAWLIGETWGKHIVVNKEAKEVEVSILLDNIGCKNALRAVCYANGLWFQEDPESGIIYVETIQDYVEGSRLNKRNFINVIPVVYPNAEDLASSIADLFHSQVYYVQPDEDNGNPSYLMDQAFERMEKMVNMSTVIDDNFSSNSSSSSSRNSRERGSSNIGELERIRELEHAAGVSVGGEPQKVHPGIVYISVDKSSNSILLRSSDNNSLTQVKGIIAKLDRPKSQVLLEVRVLSLDVTDEKARAIDLIFNDGTSSFGFANGLVNLPPVTPNGDIAIGQIGGLARLGKGFDSRSAVFQTVNDKVQSRVEFLDAAGKIKSIATPSLMVADSEASRVFVGTESTILTGVDVESNTTNGDNPVITITKDPETERRDIGTTLVITPKIHSDKSVTIRVMQEHAAQGLTRTVVYGDTDAGQAFETTDIKKETIASTVVGKSGELLALGGLISESVETKNERIPFLSEMPILGKLFEREYKDVKESELVVLIRPYVILSPDDAEKLSSDFVKNTVTHSAISDGSLKTNGENPLRLKNLKNRLKYLGENLKLMETPLEF